MKKLVLFSVLIIPITSNAIQCESDCLVEGIALIKKAAKLKACERESKLLANALAKGPVGPNALDSLESCQFKAKIAAKADKAYAKRLERLNKALGAR